MLDRLDIKFFKLAVGMDFIKAENDVDVTARCPMCSSSERWKNTKRLHLYTKNGITNVNCFTGDCMVHNKSMYSFLGEFYPSLLPQYKRENFGNTMEKLSKGETEDVFGNLKKKPKQLSSEILVHDMSPYLTDVKKVPEALEYLRGRGLEYKESRFGKWYFGHQDLKIGEKLYPISNALVIPLYNDNSLMYGFYSRSIKDKAFYTYMHEANLGYKIWNWFNIDLNQPVFIYEGIFDAIAGGLPNSIALMGAKLPENRLKELKYPVFVLDNDKTGLLNSLDYVKGGHQVYIQPDKYQEKDMNDLKLNHDIIISDMIQSNLYNGISAEVRIKSKL